MSMSKSFIVLYSSEIDHLWDCQMVVRLVKVSYGSLSIILVMKGICIVEKWFLMRKTQI